MKMKFALSTLTYLFIAGLQFISSQNPNTSQQNSPEIFRMFNKTSLGENVFVVNSSMDIKEVQSLVDTVFNRQSLRKGEFSKNRYAILFKPGKYDLDIQVNYYMEIAGLGQSPEDVVITGAIRSNTLHNNSVLTNFWRSVENLTVIPKTDSTMVWGVSQAAPLRRVHIKGNLQLFDKGYASGGFLADSKVDGTISSGPQQQWFTRNTIMKKWNWKTTWGWDFPMLAMSAASIGRADQAMDFLLMDAPKNRYLLNGYNYQDARLSIYLPGNGGLLTAVAKMCVSNQFPRNGKWKVKWENLNEYVN